MAGGGSEKKVYLDSIDPDDYVIGVIHFPPGFEGKDLFNAASESMLQKYFRKLAKHPSKPLLKRLPTAPDNQILKLISEGESSQTCLPFVGPYSKGGYCLRHLDIHRLQISLTNKEDNVYGLSYIFYLDFLDTHFTLFLIEVILAPKSFIQFATTIPVPGSLDNFTFVRFSVFTFPFQRVFIHY